MNDHPHEHIWTGVCVLLLVALSVAITMWLQQYRRAEDLQAQVEVLDGQVEDLVRENQRLENRDPYVRFRNDVNARLRQREELRERMKERETENPDHCDRPERPHSIERSSLADASV